MAQAAANRVVHLELHTGALAQASAFYEELLGWSAHELEGRDGSYLALELGTALSGGFVQCPGPRSLWLPYVEVADIRRAMARAGALGASVLLEPREGPAGWRSVVASSAGAELAFWQAKR
jgi:predicted enzyme related to lactoylglutathione lyase